MHDAVRRPMIRTFHHEDFAAEQLAERKAREGHVISVCLPARDEADTVGAIVTSVRAELVERVGLVDEVLVLDDHSSDRTAEVAADAGARVLAVDDVLPELGRGEGKGEALWKSVAAAEGDLIVWCDADITDFGPRFVVGLVGPLLAGGEVDFVKGFYDRPVGPATHGGGRVTELVARPAIALLFPHLSSIVQPLAGEYAGRRSLLERLPFVQGYGVDLGLLVDIAELEGTNVLAQVDLGTRRHRNRPLDELGPQALAVLQTALRRADADAGGAATLVRPDLEPVEVEVGERPPLVDVPAYRRQSA
jgi:glucosyl-3-phosphoglycerate synthase